VDRNFRDYFQLRAPSSFLLHLIARVTSHKTDADGRYAWVSRRGSSLATLRATSGLRERPFLQSTFRRLPTKFSDRFHTKSSSSASLWAIQRHTCSMDEFPGRPLPHPSTGSQSLWMMASNARRMLGCRAPGERPVSALIFFLPSL
jgi:hypothetical protein